MNVKYNLHIAAGDSLHQAQLNKLDALIAKADLKAGDNVLEIGCGWGSLALRAVQEAGCTVSASADISSTSITCTVDWYMIVTIRVSYCSL